MNIALVDDEKIYLDEIARVCERFGYENNLEIEISVFSDAEDFLGALDGTVFSMVFMDIYMNGMNGVFAAKKLRELDSNCILIFLTSSSEHMPEAFSCHAFEYITKPFTEQRVAETLKDAIKVMPAPTKYINLYSDRKNLKVMLDEIVSVVTDAHYIKVRTADGSSIRCRMTMAGFTEQVNDPRFILVNKGIAVNADRIIGFENNCCVTDDGEQLPIRVRDRIKIERAVQSYNFDKIRSRQRCAK